MGLANASAIAPNGSAALPSRLRLSLHAHAIAEVLSSYAYLGAGRITIVGTLIRPPAISIHFLGSIVLARREIVRERFLQSR